MKNLAPFLLLSSSLISSPFVKTGISYTRLMDKGWEKPKNILGKSWYASFGDCPGLQLSIGNTSSIEKEGYNEFEGNVEYHFTWKDIQIAPAAGYFSFSYQSKHDEFDSNNGIHSFKFGIRAKKKFYPFYIQGEWDNLFKPTVCRFWRNKDDELMGGCKPGHDRYRISAKIGYQIKKWNALTLEIGAFGKYFKPSLRTLAKVEANFWF